MPFGSFRPHAHVRPRVTLIAAVARNGVIGDGRGMLWHLPEDFAHFKRTTMGHTLVMGRGTFDSIGRVLPGRRTIVLTRDPGWRHEGVESARSLDAALALAAEPRAGIGTEHADRVEREVFVAGGGQVYREALPLADRLLVTEVDLEPQGSVVFPEIDPAVWVETSRSPGETCMFVSYARR